MRKRNSAAKPAARTWLVQIVMASSNVDCQSLGPIRSMKANGGCKACTILAHISSSSADIQRASEASDSTSENKTAASVVSGVVGKSFSRTRSANSLTNALRDEKP